MPGQNVIYELFWEAYEDHCVLIAETGNYVPREIMEVTDSVIAEKGDC